MYKRTDELSLWHQQYSTTVDIHGPDYSDLIDEALLEDNTQGNHTIYVMLLILLNKQRKVNITVKDCQKLNLN